MNHQGDYTSSSAMQQNIPRSGPTSAVGDTAVNIPAVQGQTRDWQLSDLDHPQVLGKRTASPQESNDSLKRLKVLSEPRRDSSLTSYPPLLPEIWQHIFTFLDPLTLCRLCRVNKSFASYLECGATPSARPDLSLKACLKPIDGEAVWALSRQAHLPSLPAPISGISEYDMLTLITQAHCQTCHRKPTMPRSNINMWQAGPGVDGVTLIWPFKRRLCGTCFLKATVKDVNLILSEDSLLSPGLPYAFRTDDLHWVPSWAMESSPGAAKRTSATPLAKVYYQPAIDELRGMFDTTQQGNSSMPPTWLPIAIESVKTLDRQCRTWFQWERSIPTGMPVASFIRSCIAPARSAAMPVTMAKMTATLVAPPGALQAFPLLNSVVKESPTTSLPPLTTTSIPIADIGAEGTIQLAKVTKENEILRLCQTDVVPPIGLDTLLQSSAYKDALRDTFPMTSDSWAILKSRLLTEQDEAAEVEYKRTQMSRYLQAAWTRQPSRTLTSSDIAALRQNYEATQAPMRHALGLTAARIIHESYADGALVTRLNSADFAADVLARVRAEFSRDAHSDQGSEHYLNLDAMRWLFDNKIKPLVKRSHYAIFECCECDSGRHYALESLVQHFGAKHESDFGYDNIIVHWQKAEWPEIPPFVCKTLQIDYRGDDHGLPGSLNTDMDNPKGKTIEPMTSAQIRATALTLPDLLKSYGNLQSLSPGQEMHSSSNVHVAQTALSNIAPIIDHRLRMFSNSLAQVWHIMTSIRGLEPCLRFKVALWHSCNTLRTAYYHDITLDEFASVLQLPETLTLQQECTLLCRSCVVRQSERRDVRPTFASYIANSRQYDIGPWIAHLQTAHFYPGMSTSWVSEIFVPDNEEVFSLMLAVGMNDQKLALLAQVCPGAFPSPLPVIGTVTEALGEIDDGKLEVIKRSKAAKALNGGANPSPRATNFKPNSPDKYSRKREFDEKMYDSLPEASGDEHDPRRPAVTDLPPGPGKSAKMRRLTNTDIRPNDDSTSARDSSAREGKGWNEVARRAFRDKRPQNNGHRRHVRRRWPDEPTEIPDVIRSTDPWPPACLVGTYLARPGPHPQSEYDAYARSVGIDVPAPDVEHEKAKTHAADMVHNGQSGTQATSVNTRKGIKREAASTQRSNDMHHNVDGKTHKGDFNGTTVDVIYIDSSSCDEGEIPGGHT